MVECLVVDLVLLIVIIALPSVSADQTDEKENFLSTLESINETIEILQKNLISCILVAGSLITIVIGGLAYLLKVCTKSFQSDFAYAKFP